MDYGFITDILEKGIQKSRADVCILRWMRREQLQATLVDGNPGTSSQIVLSGIGCRSLIQGSWGFCSSTDTEDIPDIILTSEKFANYKPGDISVCNIPQYTMKTHRGGPTLKAVDEFSEMAREAHKTVKGLPHVISCRIGVLMVTDYKTVVTTDGVSTETFEPRILGSITVIAKSGSTLCHYTEVTGGEYTPSSIKEELPETAEKAAEIASVRLTAQSPPSGIGKVLLGGEVVGLLAHEALGHAAEADIAKRGSFLSGRLGEEIVSPSVSVIDDGTLKGCFGTTAVDDEGVPGKKTTIIKKGVLLGFLHSRETACEAGVDPTGNARAWLYSREPQVRMTNTFLAPGDASFQELLEDVGSGLYLKGMEGGNANPDGTFMIITTLAQKIEKGELTSEWYRGPVIIGDALKIFQGIERIGDKDTFVMTPSLCGKGGSAFVGQGGPAITAELFMEGPND